VLHNSASTLSWSLVNLTSDVTGILPIANGGTNSSTALGAFNNLSPLTTRGDLLTRDATNNVRIAIGGTGTILKSDGTDPSWNTPASVGIVTGSGTTGNLPYWTDGPNGVLGDTDLVYDGGSYTTTKPVVAQYFKTVADATHYATWAMDSFGTATFTISGGTPKSNFTHAVQIHSDTTAQFGVYTAAGTSALTTTISTGGTLLSITALSPSTGLVLRPTTTFTGVPIIDVQNASSISLFKIIENTGAATFSGDVTHSSTATSVGVHTFTAQDVHNGGISLGSSGVLTNVTAAGTTGFQLQDPTDRTAGANNLTASIETKDASATFHRIFDASWDGRYGFGYSVSGSQIAKTGHVLSFIQIDGNSPSGAPHYVGILSNVGHTSTGQTAPTGPYGLIGAAANTVASGMTGNLMVGTAGGVYSNSDTAFTGKIAAGLMANIAQTATTGNAEPTTLDVTMGNGGHFKGGYDHIAGLWVQTPRGGGSGTGYPTNLPGVVSGVRVNIPVWGAALAATAAGAASELWAIHGTGVAEGVNIKMWPTITGYIKMHYPRSTSKSTTRAVHAYWEPWPNTATIRGNAADGDTYFDDGTNFRKGLWEYAGGWAKLMQYTQTDAIAGAGGAATLAANTNGATGPTTAAQAKWAKIVCLDGTAGWIPVWV
jgi:hypothetical protein